MADYLLGLDYGTGGAKACIINAQGDVLGYAFEEYRIFHDNPGWSEHDAMGYWEVACRLIQKCLAESRVNPADIRGMGVSSALPSMVMVDENNYPIHRAYNLMDRRAVKEVAWLKEMVGEKNLMQITANRLEDHPSIVNLLWEKNNRPDTFKQIRKALTIDGFVTLKLTGHAVVSYSGAPFYGVYNILDRRFDNTILEKVGIDQAMFPDLVDCEEIAGAVTAEAAAETGLAPGIPVFTQVHFNASCLAAGITEPGDIMSNLGTVGNFGVVFTDPNFMASPEGLLMINLAFSVDSKKNFITIPSTITGGQSLRYIRDNFSQLEVETERVLGVSSYDLLNLQAAKVPVGSDGLIILPFLMGERTPIWDPNARAVIFGLTLSHSKGHLIRAMMEGVAYALYDSFRIIKQANIKINYPIVLNEGGAVSRLWRQIITDVFNAPTVLVKRRTGAPFGDAILAGVVTGVLKDYSVAKEWTEYIDCMEPDPENHKTYMEYFSLYKEIYEHVKDDFQVLARLREG
jgi:sugar (pentulose or hexulose) kinase